MFCVFTGACTLGPMFSFVGVSTGQSSIMQVFPRWMADLGRAVPLVGIDLPLHAPAQQYRDVVLRMNNDPAQLGGLVTTHKLDLCAAAGDLFDELDPYARLCGEISCISKQGERLIGHAKDPITAGLSLRELLPQDYWTQMGGAVLCLGAGGAGLAISLHLLNEAAHTGSGPTRLIMTDTDIERLQHAAEIHARLAQPFPVEYVQSRSDSTQVTDQVLHEMPEGSLIINATGMGKDRPGSPVGAAALFPHKSVVWELNYRGELGFLRQAQAQSTERHLRVADGWRYFLYGWTKVIEEVLHIELNEAQFVRWAALAR